MKLSEKSLLAKWYMHVHGSLPKSLCPFFWNTLLSIPLGILFFVGFLWPADDFSQKKAFGRLMARSGRGLILEILLFLAGFAIYKYVVALKYYTANTLWGTLGVLCTAGLIALFVFLRKKVLDIKYEKQRARWEKNRLEEEQGIEKPATAWQIFKAGINAWYEKNCPIIDWQK